MGFPGSSPGKIKSNAPALLFWIESTCNAGDSSSIPGSGRSAGEGIGYPPQYSWASLVAQLVKNPPAMWRPGFYPWVGKIPWGRERLHTPVFWPGEFHGLYSSWGRKELDMTVQLSLTQVFSTTGPCLCILYRIAYICSTQSLSPSLSPLWFLL